MTQRRTLYPLAWISIVVMPLVGWQLSTIIESIVGSGMLATAITMGTLVYLALAYLWLRIVVPRARVPEGKDVTALVAFTYSSGVPVIGFVATFLTGQPWMLLVTAVVGALSMVGPWSLWRARKKSVSG